MTSTTSSRTDPIQRPSSPYTYDYHLSQWSLPIPHQWRLHVLHASCREIPAFLQYLCRYFTHHPTCWGWNDILPFNWETEGSFSQPYDNTREQPPSTPDIAREPLSHTLVSQDPLDFDPLKYIPVSTSFQPPNIDTLPVDPKTAAYQRRNFGLLTLHEQLGHLSFSILRLMKICNITPPWFRTRWSTYMHRVCLR